MNWQVGMTCNVTFNGVPVNGTLMSFNELTNQWLVSVPFGIAVYYAAADLHPPV